MASGSTIHNIAEAPLITGPRRARSKVNLPPEGRAVPELAIAPAPEGALRIALVVKAIDLVVGLELVIALAAEVARPIVPAAEPIDLVVAEPAIALGAEGVVPIVLAVAEPGNASVATMFLGAAVPARAVPLAVVGG